MKLPTSLEHEAAALTAAILAASGSPDGGKISRQGNRLRVLPEGEEWPGSKTVCSVAADDRQDGEGITDRLARLAKFYRRDIGRYLRGLALDPRAYTNQCRSR